MASHGGYTTSAAGVSVALRKIAKKLPPDYAANILEARRLLATRDVQVKLLKKVAEELKNPLAFTRKSLVDPACRDVLPG
jgi:hypothetical protein